jgi:hypothetical protein
VEEIAEPLPLSNTLQVKEPLLLDFYHTLATEHELFALSTAYVCKD